MHNSAQLRCFENGNDDFGVEAFWIGDAARIGYFVPLNGPLNGHPPSSHTIILIFWGIGPTIHVWFFVQFYDNVPDAYLGVIQVLRNADGGAGVEFPEKSVT